MIRNYFKIAWRVLLKNKRTSLVNILGLAIGITTVVLIVFYVYFEFSFDNFHSKSDRIYRVESNFFEGDVLTDEFATSAFGYGSALKNNVSGIQKFTRIALDKSEQIVGYNNEYIRENGITYTNSEFFEIFDFNLIEGNRATMLSEPNSVVITEKVARKFFNKTSPLGKVISFGTKDNIHRCKITGILEDIPQNSHIQFDYFISYKSLPEWKREFWYIHEAYTYVLLDSNTNPKSIEKSFPELSEKFKTEDALKSKIWGISLVPLKDIHLNKWKQYEREIKGNKTSLLGLLAVVLMILIIVWANYINISIAKSYDRIREIAVRKVLGAGKRILIVQFMFESMIVNVLALLLSIFLIGFSLPYFNLLINTPISTSILNEPYFWIVFGFVFFIGIILSGFYPAIVLSSFKPVELLRGKLNVNHKSLTPLKFLVVLQFSMALFLIVSTGIVYKQVSFMQSQELGVNIENKLIVKFPAKTENLDFKLQSFSEVIKKRHDVQNVTISGSIPGKEVAMFASNNLKSANSDKNRLYEMLTVDYEYFNTYQISLLAGRSFSKSFGADEKNIVVNEASLKFLEILSPEKAIGKEVMLEGQPDPFKIIGVTQNWHQKSLSNSYTPIMFILNGTIGWIPPSFITINYMGSGTDELVSEIEGIWKGYFNNSSFDYFFADNFFEAQYSSDQNHGKLFSFFTLLALVLTCLGLYALTSHAAHQRIKEIGIRKVLGANIMDLLYMLSKDFLKLIMISLVIATPITWYLMKFWLQNFAFRTAIHWWVFVIAGLIILLITLLTVSFQSIPVTRQNPIKSLKTE